jgi:ABC-type transport system involved in cytochrome c biogenesis permease subunit
MRKEIRILIYLVASAVLAYFCAFFITLESNITKWSNSGRMSLLMIWGILNVGLIIKEMLEYKGGEQ